MKSYDFRFNQMLIKSFIGRKLTKYKHAEFMYTNSVTGILCFQVDDISYRLTSEYESLDFFGLDEEATVFRIDSTNWDTVDNLINNNIIDNNINETISKIVLVNDHTTLKINNHMEYDMWDTKAIIFSVGNREICFAKQDCWFSQEIEIYKGYDLLSKVGDGQEILTDFENIDSKIICVEREIVEII